MGRKTIHGQFGLCLRQRVYRPTGRCKCCTDVVPLLPRCRSVIVHNMATLFSRCCPVVAQSVVQLRADAGAET